MQYTLIYYIILEYYIYYITFRIEEVLVQQLLWSLRNSNLCCVDDNEDDRTVRRRRLCATNLVME